MNRPNRYATATGEVDLVSFKPPGHQLWGFTVIIDTDEMPEPETYQIDNAKFTIDGKEVSKTEVFHWLIGDGSPRPTPRVLLTGHFGMDSYEVCHTAEFFSE